MKNALANSWLRILLAVSLFLSGALGSWAADRKTNFVVILCDDLGYGDLACFGSPVIKTPHLDKLASEGLRLTHCYSSFPVCSPSRAGLLTGRNANRSGIRDWIPADSGIYLREGETTVAQLLKKAGYGTCHAGKWHLNSKTDGSETTPGDHGFDHWFYTQNNASPSHANPVNFVRNGERAGPLRGYSALLVVEEAMRWLDDHKAQPFFLNIWFHEPHEPIASAGEFTGLYPRQEDSTKADYYGNVSQMDAAVGRLMQYLDEHQLRESTFVFFTSDNGPETLRRYRGAERSHGSPGPLRGMKLHITEAGYRVPGILRWPGKTKLGTISTEPINNTDLLPTICEIAGLPVPADRPIDGTSFLPLFQGRPVERRVPLYWQYDYAISKPWVIALRQGPWKLLGNAALDQFELYNVADDIGEAQNLAGSDPERVHQMANEMKRLHTEINAEGKTSKNPPPRR